MRIEFSHFPSHVVARESGVPVSFFFDNQDAARKLRQIEDAAFDRVIVDDPAGLLSNMDIAALAANATSGLGIVLSHWAGAIAPAVAARQLAALDRLANGRLSLRVLAGTGGDGARSHVAVLERTDEYLVLLKRLWLNAQPFDHEGPFYSVRGGFVASKGPQAAGPQIRMGGLSGTALKVAGRHADVFELAPGTVPEVARLIERVRLAASEFGRATKIRFALPVWLDGTDPAPKSEGGFVRLRGSFANSAASLLAYADLGIGEFIVGGHGTTDAIERFGQEFAPLVRNSLARREVGVPLLRPVARPRYI